MNHFLSPISDNSTYYNDFETLVIEFKYKKEGHTFVCSMRLDDHPLVNADNAEAWARYFHRKMKEFVTEAAMQSDQFKSIEHEIGEEQRRHDEWMAREPERRRREQHKKELRRTPTLGYIPDGLKADYAKLYGEYIESAIMWTPEDNDEFLYQIRSLERMCTKCVQRCIEQNRPDAAFAQTAELLRRLPRWKGREELTKYFNQYKPRLRKLVKATCQSMTSSAIAWNCMEKLIEANALIEALQSEFTDWGIKPKSMLSLCSFAVITGDPTTIERKPDKQEQQEIYDAEQHRKAEEEEEAERHSLIPLNQYLEKSVFTRSNIGWECQAIGHALIVAGQEVKKYLEQGQSHDALLLFLQIVKSMCRHFVSDEHYNMFDDFYDPHYSCAQIVDDLNTAYARGKFSLEDIDFFHLAWKEIEKTEAYTDYGIGNYKFRF